MSGFAVGFAVGFDGLCSMVSIQRSVEGQP
jgi:hypothetical protein